MQKNWTVAGVGVSGAPAWIRLGWVSPAPLLGSATVCVSGVLAWI